MQIIRKSQATGVAGVQTPKLLRTALGMLSVSVALIAIFPLAAWAELAGWHHALQHVLIFSAGAGLGVAAIGVRRPGKERE